MPSQLRDAWAIIAMGAYTCFVLRGAAPTPRSPDLLCPIVPSALLDPPSSAQH